MDPTWFWGPLVHLHLALCLGIHLLAGGVELLELPARQFALGASALHAGLVVCESTKEAAHPGQVGAERFLRFPDAGLLGNNLASCGQTCLDLYWRFVVTGHDRHQVLLLWAKLWRHAALAGVLQGYVKQTRLNALALDTGAM